MGTTARDGGVVGEVGGKYYYADGTIMDGGSVAALERPSLMVYDDDDYDVEEPTQQTSSIPSSPLDNKPSEDRMSNEEEEVESGGGRREYDDAN